GQVMEVEPVRSPGSEGHLLAGAAGLERRSGHPVAAIGGEGSGEGADLPAWRRLAGPGQLAVPAGPPVPEPKAPAAISEAGLEPLPDRAGDQVGGEGGVAEVHHPAQSLALTGPAQGCLEGVEGEGPAGPGGSAGRIEAGLLDLDLTGTQGEGPGQVAG